MTNETAIVEAEGEVVGEAESTVEPGPKPMSNFTTIATIEVIISNPDKYSNTMINVGFVAAAAICLIFSGTAFIALMRTRHIPKTARILSSVLLLFDCATTLTYAIRKFISDSNVARVFQLIGIGWSYMAFINVAIMALERLVAFQWPYFYMRHSHGNYFLKMFALVVVFFLSIWTGEWAYCYIIHEGVKKTRACVTPIVTKYMSATFTTTTLLSCACFVQILSIIIKHKNQVQTETVQKSRNNRSTIVVFLCSVNYIAVAIINLFFIYTLTSLTIIVRRTLLDVLYMINGLIDTLVYVLWYRECRYELIKLTSLLFPGLKPKAEKLRMEIFDVMGTSTSNAAPNANNTTTPNTNPPA